MVFHIAAHNKPSLIRVLLRDGGGDGFFKHEVNDGVWIGWKYFEFLSHVQDSLKDHYDIKMLTYLMVARYVWLSHIFLYFPVMTISLKANPNSATIPTLVVPTILDYVPVSWYLERS